MKFVSPSSQEELEEYFEFRWQILRAPLDMPRGSEKDDLEDVSYHLTARSNEGTLVGVAKYKPSDDTTAQISHIAVNESQRGKGVGKKLVETLEAVASQNGYERVFLTAREYNIPYFQKIGYSLGEEEVSPLPDIKIFKMHKELVVKG